VLLAREKYEVDKVLEIELPFLSIWTIVVLSGYFSKMREQLKHDISAIEYEIQVAKESQAKFEKWDVRKVKQGNITDLFVLTLTLVLLTPFFRNSGRSLST
jgi:hypothetical protein